MRTRRILIGTAIAAVALCWTLCGNTPAVDAVPAPAAESAVSVPCAPQTRSSEPSSNIITTEPVTEPETVPVAGSASSSEPECPQVAPELETKETKTVQPKPTETPPAQDGMIYVPGFGYLKSEGPGEWSVSEDMYENGNKIGIVG